MMRQRNQYLLTILLCFFVFYCSIFTAKGQAATESVLAQGNWYKIGVLNSGIHKIDAQLLRTAGFQPENINPKFLRLYGNGGGMLPQANNAPRYDDLQENAIWIKGEEDNRFDNNDYILFYAQSPHAWKFDPTTASFENEFNLYSDTTYYYLTVGDSEGLRMTTLPNLSGATLSVSTFDDFTHYEKDENNIIRSGREWYGEIFGFQNEYSFDFNAEGLVANSEIKLNSAVMSRALQVSSFSISTNGQVIGTQSINPVTSQTYDFKGRDAINRFSFPSTWLSNPNQIRLVLNYSSDGGTGYLNNLTLNYKRLLKPYGTQTQFQNIESTQHSLTEFVIQEANQLTQVWDISNPLRPAWQASNFANNQCRFTANTAQSLKQYIAWEGENFPLPIALHRVANQDLHGLSVPNLVIVSPPAFLSEAMRLADLRRSHDGLSVEVVSTEQVYNEFASGKRDLTAIRDFMRLLYQKSPETLKYLLLFGDASYDYKNRIANNTNLVPVYESYQSLHPIFSYSSDDYFGFLEENEGEWQENTSGDHTLEIGIGRITAKTPAEARTVVDKLIHYAQNPAGLGKWRTQVTFVADDGDANTHQRDADRLAENLEENYDHIEQKKFYLDAFEQVSTPNGELSPDLTEKLYQEVEEGTLIVNFTGHGAERGWTEEKILETPNILNWRNRDRLAVFVTATCEFGRYDDPGENSGAEVALLSSNGAAVGLLTTTRPVFSSTNFLVNQAFYQKAFEPENMQTGEMPRLGDILKFTKNNSLNGSINRNFALLGDPSMMMAYPKHRLVLTQINGQDFEHLTDTLNALDFVQLRGEVQNYAGEKIENFNGIAEITFYDKREVRQTLGKSASVMNFNVRENKLFKGKVSVENGVFEGRFVIPKNINYQVGEAKIMMYAQPSQGLEDASGGTKNILLGGSNANQNFDSTPPQITAYLNDENFIDGSKVGRNALLIAELFDEHGLNISSTGIGQTMTAILDEDFSNPILLNEYYTTALDSYQHGKIVYPLRGLSAGRHTLLVRVWDTYNNPNTAEITFYVDPSFEIQYLKNFPNPVQTSTVFELSHNLAGEDLKLILEIFNTQGQVLKRFEQEIVKSEALLRYQWDGTDQKGQRIGSGLYIYRVSLQAPKLGLDVQESRKMVLIN